MDGNISRRKWCSCFLPLRKRGSEKARGLKRPKSRFMDAVTEHMLAMAVTDEDVEDLSTIKVNWFWRHLTEAGSRKKIHSCDTWLWKCEEFMKFYWQS